MSRRADRRRGAGCERGAAGFTLVELLVVIAIVALIAGVAVPSSGDNRSFRLAAVETQVRDALNHARMLASTTGQTHGVLFDTREDAFAVIDGSGRAVRDPLTKRGYVVTFDRPDQPQAIDIQSASFGSNGAAAIFGPDGLPEKGGTVLVACKGVSVLFTLDRATGKLSSS